MISIQLLIEEIQRRYTEAQLPIFEIELIISRLTGLSRAQIKSRTEQILASESVKLIKSYCESRAQGEPIAYLFNEREFWGLSLYVDENVLIPRHETELIIEYCTEKYTKDSQLTCLDLGTGSGAIVLALASEFPLWQFLATDKSLAALRIAQRNANSLQLNTIHFCESNWFDKISKQKFDLIISNPPYIAADDPHLSIGDLLKEPLSALVAPEIGLLDLKRIIAGATAYLASDGELILEHGSEQGSAVRELLTKYGYNSVITYLDYSGLERYSVASIY